MRFLIALLAFIACDSAASIFDSELNTQWIRYKEFHHKLYKDETEDSYRQV